MQRIILFLFWLAFSGLLIFSSCEEPTSPTSDTTDPEITLLGNNPDTADYGVAYTDPGATALDDTDGDITSEITTTSDVNNNQQGDYSITYKVEDYSGNKASATRSVFVYNPNQVSVSAIVGSYTVSEDCSGNNYSQGAVISSDPSDDENFYIDNFYAGFFDNVLCTINGTDIVMEEQDFDNGAYTIEGLGYISISGNSVIITFTYTVTDNTNNTSQTCMSLYMK